MASYNKVLLMGNLTRDPEVTYTPSQMLICKFGLAVSRKFRTKTGEDREEVLFIDCTAFDKRGEVISQYFTKGKPIFIEGQLKLDSWDDKTTGQKRSKIYVIVDGFQFVGGRDGGGGGGGGYAGEDEGSMGGGGGPPQRAPANRPPQGGGGYQGRPAPQRPGPGAQRPPAGPPVEQPFPDENQFKEDDIPF